MTTSRDPEQIQQLENRRRLSQNPWLWAMMAAAGILVWGSSFNLGRRLHQARIERQRLEFELSRVEALSATSGSRGARSERLGQAPEVSRIIQDLGLQDRVDVFEPLAGGAKVRLHHLTEPESFRLIARLSQLEGTGLAHVDLRRGMNGEINLELIIRLP